MSAQGPQGSLEVGVFDSGSPRGEKRWWHVTLGGVTVFESTREAVVRDVARRLRAAIAKATGSAT